MKKNSDKEAFSFEKGIERLEQIINDLDQNNVQLEQALDLFGEGIKLIKQCNGLLDSAEAKVKVLLENSKGELVVTDQD
ncbi:MAG: exodeoxyribonuclease VII small subunit [Dehalobacter sp. 4CP]|uniref:exodeoxyribonuclease VII small subunit n=1 Tax=Dehalobacter sp. CP TaxID=2594474 RepID=UPI0013C837C4|nr:exodeoxyribonuclease VII small subunit [Dehalobacter sp. 4CP]